MDREVHNLLKLLKKTEFFFKEKGIESPRVDSELLFANVLKCARLDLFLFGERILDENTLDILRGLIKRRANREPLQHILGEVSFDDLQLKVDKRALIPRSETEEMVHILYEKLLKTPGAILDLGTGTGAIGLSLAKHYPQSSVTLVDKSWDALSLARENAEKNKIHNVQFMHSHWLDNVMGVFDLVVANPPYLTLREWEEASPEVKVFDPREALIAGGDGMSDLLEILEKSKPHLSKNGLLALETGIGHHQALMQRAGTLGYRDIESIKDMHQRDRFILLSI